MKGGIFPAASIHIYEYQSYFTVVVFQNSSAAGYFLSKNGELSEASHYFKSIRDSIRCLKRFYSCELVDKNYTRLWSTPLSAYRDIYFHNLKRK